MFFPPSLAWILGLPVQECWHKLGGGGVWYVWKNWSRIARFWKYLRGSQKSGRFQTYLESFGAVVMVLGLERLEDFGRFLAGFRDCNNFWKVAIWMECHLWMELFVVTFQKTYPIQSAHVAQMNWRLLSGSVSGSFMNGWLHVFFCSPMKIRSVTGEVYHCMLEKKLPFQKVGQQAAIEFRTSPFSRALSSYVSTKNST